MLQDATPKKSNKRRWILAGTLVVSACLAALVAWPVLAGYTDPPRFGREAAEKAVGEARKAGGAKWAPEALMGAESALKTALLEYRRQEATIFPPMRDYRPVRIALRLAEEKGKAAAKAAGDARAVERGLADDALAKAESDAGNSSDIGDSMHLGMFERKLLQKSKIALNEARIRYAGEDYEQAASLAREASSNAVKVAGNAAQAAERFAEPSLVRNWRRMMEQTIAWSRQTGGQAIVVLKDNRRLDLYDDGRLVRSYRADMGYRSFSDKLRAGDAATPEGRYRVTSKRGPGSATYYKAFDLDYPNAEDRAQFERLRRAGQLPRWARLGGSIQIHGEGGRGRDWTRGCVALANGDMDDLFRRIGVGTPVTIVGGDGQGLYARLARQAATTTSSGTR